MWAPHPPDILQIRKLVVSPEEWDANIWSEYSDSNIEFDPAIKDREVMGTQPPKQITQQQKQADARRADFVYLCSRGVKGIFRDPSAEE